MSSDTLEEENFTIAKSVFKTYVVSAMAYEYIVAQNVAKNPRGKEFLDGIEKIAHNVITTFGIPFNEDDMKQINEHYVKKILEAFDTGVLKK